MKVFHKPYFFKNEETKEGEIAISSTQANFIANIAKEYLNTNTSNLSNIRFYETSVKELGSSNSEDVTNFATEASIFESIPKNLRKEFEVKSLIAWLREAIKAKTELILHIDEWWSLMYEDFFEKEEVQPYLTEENREAIKTFIATKKEKADINNKFSYEKEIVKEEYLNTLSIKERNDYFLLETQCSVLGSYVHPDGEYAKARKDLAKKINNPIEVKNIGGDKVFKVINTPKYSLEQIDEKFFDIQRQYREKQSRLNSLKFKIEEYVNNELERRKNERIRISNLVSSQEKGITILRDKIIETMKADVGSLKIVIPNDLKDMYNYIDNLAKNK